jgi:alpha-mannosidase
MDERIIQRKLAILSGRMVVKRWSVDGWEVREAEFTPAGEYTFEGDWRPVQANETFAALKTLFFRAQANILKPTTPTGTLYLYFGSPDLANVIAGSNAPANFSGLEGLLRVDGRSYAGVDANHFRIPAPETGKHELEVEFISWLRAMCQSELRAMRAGFAGVSILEVDPDIEAAYYDLRFADEAIPQVKDPRRKGLLAKALEEAMLAMDMTLTGEAFAAEVRQARDLLKKRLAEIEPDPEAGQICLVGHTHIDTAWLWPLSETVRKCGRTFATAARLMEQYPDFHFACSQPQLYAYTQEHYPDLYQEIKKWVKSGRWETTGAMWIETDCNVPSGEALIRQMLHGLGYFQQEFGTRPRTCWLPDVFGYPASLPEILKGCGVPYFMTCKLHWQSLNPFPYHLFHWEGLDGSQVLAHIPKLRSYYNGLPTPEQLTIAWDNFLQKVDYDEVMLPFGYGDGGGGVTAEMMEYTARAQQFPGLPATRVDTGEGYYERVMAQAPALPTWVGELYLETHRGTYTTQSRTKRANRKSELLLYEAEVAASLANLQGGAISTATLKKAWERVLLQQFHDILPGSSIGQVYDDNLADHDLAQAAALEVRNAALRWQAERQIPAGQLGVFNSLSWSRGDPLQASVPDPATPFHLQDSKGRPCPVQLLSSGNGQAHILFEPYEVPALGWEAFSIQPGPAPAVQFLRAWERGLENAMFRMEVDDEGQVVRLLDKRCNREVIPAGQAANVWQLFQDGPEREAAWNVHDTFEKRRYSFEEPATIRVVESGPVRATLLVERTYRQSRLSLRIQIYQHTPRIDFIADVDWQERQTMLKIAFPVDVRSSEANYEIQFGTVQRPTHRNTTWDQQKFEVCAHHWADLSEAGYGVSLLNDSRYGYDTKDNTLRLTALRGAEYPDPEADRGLHHFVYALLPHSGDWREGETVRHGWELNAPMTALVGKAESSARPATPLVKVEGVGIVITALKPAESGKGWILRFYEAHGGHSQAQVSFAALPKRVTATNLVEENEETMALAGTCFAVAVKPFEIKTFRVEW